MSEEKIQVVGRRDVGLLVGALVMLALSAVLQVFGIVALSRNTDQLRADATIALQTHRGVCLFRQNLEEQVRQTDRFLTTHPNGIPGIPAATFRQSEARERGTISALSDLQCSTGGS